MASSNYTEFSTGLKNPSDALPQQITHWAAHDLQGGGVAGHLVVRHPEDQIPEDEHREADRGGGRASGWGIGHRCLDSAPSPTVMAYQNSGLAAYRTTGLMGGMIVCWPQWALGEAGRAAAAAATAADTRAAGAEVELVHLLRGGPRADPHTIAVLNAR